MQNLTVLDMIDLTHGLEVEEEVELRAVVLKT